MTVNASVMVYNASHEPLYRVSFRHAVKMLFREVAVVHEQDGDRTIGPHPRPKAVRLVRYIVTKWLYRPAGWSREGVLIRDGYRCGYCRRKATTLDHIVPKCRGGKWAWENVVSACADCNSRKSDRTPEEAGMRLLIEPYVPTRAQLIALKAAA